MDTKYSFDDYNEHQVLKIPFNLVVTTVYALKYIVVLFILPILLNFLPALTDAGKLIIPYISQFAHKPANLAFILSSIPAFLIFIPMFKRVPNTPEQSWIRRIWTKGRGLLLSSFIIDMSLMIIYLLLGVRQFDGVMLAVLYIDSMLLLYVMRSKRVRNVFEEFPAYEKKAK
ncbi:DUF2919 family protein [Beggiatoa leptomitoformis]|uniref:DUF2919 family protein n=1 Tax=Beggiatoa leptomitoformis TaxID=288004 RepID=A0A2N9YAR9_9GAMM|nr:DUF2919 family protein [Beggiatoa leptomitoformis]ALG67060.1 DUF2919 family protein [Beggiatoa leptomitoformis]AUI67555.1 DUF2919 family protein [Beggiatoa leptomitoformis]